MSMELLDLRPLHMGDAPCVGEHCRVLPRTRRSTGQAVLGLFVGCEVLASLVCSVSARVQKL